jgi:hypothetical protein
VPLDDDDDSVWAGRDVAIMLGIPHICTVCYCCGVADAVVILRLQEGMWFVIPSHIYLEGLILIVSLLMTMTI